MKGGIEEVLSAVVAQLVAKGYVKMENYYIDGSKIEADANKHKLVFVQIYLNFPTKKVHQVKPKVDTWPQTHRVINIPMTNVA